MNTTNTFVARLAFLSEKRSETYAGYVAVSIAGKKVNEAQKAFQCGQLCWTAGKAGV